MASSAAALTDELAEEILLRIPPVDPARLVRAALACKRARRLVADPGFRRRFREFHGAAPLLGFFLNTTRGYVVRAARRGRRRLLPDSEREDLEEETSAAVARFVPTAPSSCLAGCADMRDWRVIDARHGRVLLHSWTAWGNSRLLVWDPITHEKRGLPIMPVSLYPDNWNAAVLCSAAGCNHLDCHGNRFTVVFVAIKGTEVLDYTYSTEDVLWSWPPNPGAHEHDGGVHLHLEPSALVGNALYFMLEPNNKVLEYNVGTRAIAVIPLPSGYFLQRSVLMTAEDGKLGVATMHKLKLGLWSREIGSDKGGRWAKRRVIDLKTLLPIGYLRALPVVAGFANGIGVIFIQTSGALFMIDLKSSRAKKLRNVSAGSSIFPYMSFCYPALGGVSTGDRLSGASSPGPHGSGVACGPGAHGGDEGSDIGDGEHSHDQGNDDDEATTSDEDDNDGSEAMRSGEDDEDGDRDDNCAYLISLLLLAFDATEGGLP